MSIYSVELHKTVVMAVTIEVEAEDALDAEEKALDEGENNMWLDWSEDDWYEPEVYWMEEVDPGEG